MKGHAKSPREFVGDIAELAIELSPTVEHAKEALDEMEEFPCDANLVKLEKALANLKQNMEGAMQRLDEFYDKSPASVKKVFNRTRAMELFSDMLQENASWARRRLG